MITKNSFKQDNSDLDLLQVQRIENSNVRVNLQSSRPVWLVNPNNQPNSEHLHTEFITLQNTPKRVTLGTSSSHSSLLIDRNDVDYQYMNLAMQNYVPSKVKIPLVHAPAKDNRVAVNLKLTKIPQIYMLNKSNFDFKKYKLVTEQDRVKRKKNLFQSFKQSERSANRSEMLKQPQQEFRQTINLHTKPSLLPTIKAKRANDTQNIITLQNQSFLYEETEKHLNLTNRKSRFLSPVNLTKSKLESPIN